MLLQLKIKNILSYKHETVFSMIPTKDKEILGNIIPKQDTCPAVLKSAVIYGPNASGKTNLIKAMGILQKILIEGQSPAVGKKLPVKPFKLHIPNIIQPSLFEVIFVQDKIKYTYGIQLTEREIIEEYLYYYPHRKKAVIFERTNKNQYRFVEAKETQKKLAEKTLENTPYLSTSSQWNLTLTQKPFIWFKDVLKISIDYLKPFWLDYTARQIEKNEKEILTYLKKADLNITGISADLKKLDKQMFPDFITNNGDKDFRYWDFTLFHKAKDERGNIHKAPFKLSEESAGTQKLLELLGPWIDIIKNHRVLLIDEIDTGLHPILAEYLIQEIHGNTANSQMITTTHNTNLLVSQLFRRDQFWITEMNPNEYSTELYSFAELKIRKDHNMEKGYLAGKYGGIPFPG